MAKPTTEGVLAKMRKLRDIVKFNGGLLNSIAVLYR